MHPVHLASASGSTAEKLLDAAQTLIQQRGYHGFSYEDVSRSVGIRKPSIHHHFPKKEDLGTQVIRRYTERFKTTLQEIERIDDPQEQLRAYTALFFRTYEPARKLCPCGMLGAESAALPQTVADAVQSFFSCNISWLQNLLEEGRASGSFDFPGNAQTQALIVLSALEGSMVVGKGLGNDECVRQVGQAVLMQLLT